MTVLRWLKILVVAELLVGGVLFGLRLNATLPAPPPVAEYTDAITGGKILAVPDRFLFDSTEKWRTLGQTYLQSTFFAKAEACWHAATDCDPLSADFALRHGCCLEQLGSLEEARQVYLRAAQIGSARIAEVAWYRIGRIHLQWEHSAEAATAFEKAGDDHLPSVFQRAKLLIRSGSAAEAAPLLERLAEDHPRDIRCWQLRARFDEVLGRPEDAAAARDTVLRSILSLPLEPFKSIIPNHEPAGLYHDVSEAMQRYQAAHTPFAAEQLLPFVRDETFWQNKLPLLLEDVASIQLDAQNLPAARSLLEKQIEKRRAPTWRTWELLARVEFAEKHLQQAWQHWNRAERLRPDAVDHDQMAQLALALREDRAARRHRGLARQASGFRAFLNDMLDDSRQMFREAVEIDDELPSAWYYLGETERLLGAPEAAKPAFERCLHLMPNHGRARDRLEKGK